VERAMRLQSLDREEKAIQVLLPVLTKFPPDTAAVWLWNPLRYFAMDLEVGAAVNNVERAPAVSVDWYALALNEALSLRLEDGVSDMVRRMGWLARDTPTYEVGAAVCAGLMPVSLEIMSFGPNARYELYRTGQYAFAAVAQKTAGTLRRSGLVTSDRIRQMIKGLSFAAALQQDANYSVAKDATGQGDLRLIADLTGDQPMADDDAAMLFDEKVLLTTYVSDREVRSGRSPSERLANAQRAFDQHVFDHLTDPRVVAYHSTSPDEIKALLDQRTILADMMLVEGEDERLITYTAVYTSDQVKVIACKSADLPGQAQWAGPERELLFHPTAPLVSLLREKIQEYPGLGRDTTPDALEALQEAADLLFAGDEGIRVFEDLRATGRDRLVVVPHGPLHFLPFHLLPFEDGILADRFTVTVLPNRELLRPRAGQLGAARQMQAFGLTFTDWEPFGLPPIAASSQEAREVALCFDIEPTLDAHATEAAFRSALHDARYVHLSTHGRNNTAGAAFQSLYLWPDESSDGRFHAYELLDLDLHNVDLLTLSACETALGRFDLLDNIRGLPAAFLLRGVRTLIGTLWDTEVTAARLFFRTLYSHLRAAPSDKAGAFRAAQEETRSRFPQYRDWGAFYLMGAS
jgi:CHAT domain-containing protein